MNHLAPLAVIIAAPDSHYAPFSDLRSAHLFFFYFSAPFLDSYKPTVLHGGIQATRPSFFPPRLDGIYFNTLQTRIRHRAVILETSWVSAHRYLNRQKRKLSLVLHFNDIITHFARLMSSTLALHSKMWIVFSQPNYQIPSKALIRKFWSYCFLLFLSSALCDSTSSFFFFARWCVNVWLFQKSTTDL